MLYILRNVLLHNCSTLFAEVIFVILCIIDTIIYELLLLSIAMTFDMLRERCLIKCVME